MIDTIRALLKSLVVGTLLLATACTATSPTPIPTPSATATPSATPAASASPTPTASATPARTPTATATPAVPPSVTTPPAGYAQSCAKAIPWGRQVTAPFVCIDVPTAGTRMPRGTHLDVRGYAGGSFESNLIVEASVVQPVTPGGSMRNVLTYAAPDVGMPGAWQTTLNFPASGLPWTWRITAYFTSPRDGSRVVETSVDVVLD